MNTRRPYGKKRSAALREICCDAIIGPRARDLWTTPEFKYAQRQRKKVEALFAELKNHSHIGLHRLRLRRLKFVREQFFPAATAQNIKRLVRFLSGPTMSLVPTTS
jgi:hypothetical protein